MITIYTYIYILGFRRPKCVYRQVKLLKYVCLVARLGQQLFKKQVLQIVLDCRYSFIKWDQFLSV